jgi:trans-aconitate methyltransferase
MTRVDYDGALHRAYHAGRRHPEGTTRQWRDLVAAHVGASPPKRWIDVGCGTGRFSVLLAEWLDAHVGSSVDDPTSRTGRFCAAGTRAADSARRRGAAARGAARTDRTQHVEPIWHASSMAGGSSIEPE